MQRLKKIVITLFLIALAFTIMTGCSKKKETAEEVQEVTVKAISLDDIKEDIFYAKIKGNFYETPQGKKTYAGITDEPNPTARLITFKDDDVLIPTIYKDDELVIRTAKAENLTFNLERFRDNGYSIGVLNLQKDANGRYSYVKGVSLVFPGSVFEAGVTQLETQMTVESILLNKINDKLVDSSAISLSGTYKGLNQNETAVCDVFVGTAHAQLQSRADIHFLESMETYELQDYNLSTDGYAVVNIPDYLHSGYYCVNGAGVFRYVSNKRADGIAGIDFNQEYFYTDDMGNTYAIGEEEANAMEDLDELVNSADCIYTTTVNTQVDGIQFVVDFANKDYLFTDEEKLRAILVTPDDNQVELESTDDGALKAYVENAIAGDYRVLAFNTANKKMRVYAAIDTEEATSFVMTGKEGSLSMRKSEITVPTLFNITWEDDSRAAACEVQSPDGMIYSKKTTPTAYVSEGYGFQSILVQPSSAGTWTVTVNGDGLGRVWINTEPYEGVEAPEG